MNFLALACAVCGAGNDPAKESYVTMSLIISALPILMLGGIIFWVVRAARKAEAAQPLTPTLSPQSQGEGEQ